jgi:hypothetical protein
MSRRKTRTLPIGSLSTGTLKPEDILPDLFYASRRIRVSAAARRTLQKLEREFDSAEDDSLSDDLLVRVVLRVLEDYTPDYCYLGSHPGDGADIGVWPAWDAIEDGRRDRDIAESRETAGPEDRYVLDVNDHGNATLYRRAGRRWIEVWAVV